MAAAYAALGRSRVSAAASGRPWCRAASRRACLWRPASLAHRCGLPRPQDAARKRNNARKQRARAGQCSCRRQPVAGGSRQRADAAPLRCGPPRPVALPCSHLRHCTYCRLAMCCTHIPAVYPPQEGMRAEGQRASCSPAHPLAHGSGLLPPFCRQPGRDGYTRRFGIT